jgi:Ca2+-binding RTX toxin-like protein
MMEPLENRQLFSTFPPVIPPSNVAATPLSSSTIKVTWSDNSPNAINFLIYRSTDNVHYGRVAIVPMLAEAWTDTTVVAGTTYFYKVEAVALTANSIFSAPANATTPASTPFAVLDAATGQLNVQGTVGNDDISLSLSGTDLRVTLNKSTLTFTKTDVKRIAVLGSSGNDLIVINAGVGGANLSGGDGNDTLIGNTGDDRLDGGAGADSIKGEDGNDTISGGDGNDTLYGQGGNDFLDGGNDNDKIVGGDGNDSIFGDNGNDRLYGQGGIDTIVGGAGMNFIQQD